MLPDSASPVSCTVLEAPIGAGTGVDGRGGLARFLKNSRP